jgi:hypothetical protein
MFLSLLAIVICFCFLFFFPQTLCLVLVFFVWVECVLVGERKEKGKEKKRKNRASGRGKTRSENGVVADVLMFGDFCRASKWLKGLSKCCCCVFYRKNVCFGGVLVNFLLLGFWFSCMFVFWISFVIWFPTRNNLQLFVFACLPAKVRLGRKL